MKPSRRSRFRADFAVPLVLATALVLPAGVPSSALADPPPWAPAHGYRAKHKGKSKGKHRRAEQQAYRVPQIGIPGGLCNRDVLGAIVGGAAGGYAGSRVGSGDGKLAAAAAGTLIGILVGGAIGRHMDRVDQNCIAQTLEQADDNRPVSWRNPDADARYTITPTKTYQAGGGRYCREYTTEAVVAGKIERTYGTACRAPDGSWQLGS